MSLALSIISVRSVREYISHSSGLLEWSGCFGVRIEKKIDPASCRSTWHDRSGSTRWQRNWRSLENWDDFAPKHRTDRRNFVNRKISSNAMTMTVFKHSKQYRFARSPIINIYFIYHCSRVEKNSNGRPFYDAFIDFLFDRWIGRQIKILRCRFWEVVTSLPTSKCIVDIIALANFQNYSFTSSNIVVVFLFWIFIVNVTEGNRCDWQRLR